MNALNAKALDAVAADMAKRHYVNRMADATAAIGVYLDAVSLPALVKALEDITNVSARSTSSSDHDRLHAALDALDKARDIARAALASHKTGG